jgi:hypothetical protein
LGLDEHVDGVVGAGLLEECRDGDPPDLRPYEHTEKSVGGREGGRETNIVRARQRGDETHENIAYKNCKRREIGGAIDRWKDN